MGSILDNINSPKDLKKMDVSQLEELSKEIRRFLIENISKTGGHIASNLGVVELTLSIHSVFNTPTDKVIWDVGHQCYIQKIITGRKNKFDTFRQLGGISGFPKSCESEYDSFNTGHSSTSISAALGIAKARDIKKENYSVVAVIGDGALTGGMAFEALNDAGRSNNDLIVILNDNEMSISRNVGGMSSYLNKIRTEPIYFKAKDDIDILLNKIPAIGKPAAKALDRVKGTIKYMLLPGVIFEELGFKYIGPIDGHNISILNNCLNRAKLLKGPVLIHIITQKGKGYLHAEESPSHYHGIAPFEIETGKTIGQNNGPSFTDVFGKHITKLAKEDNKLVAITAAMLTGTGLDLFSKEFSDRFFDVGIAEQHAVTFAAGLAKNGLKPVIAIYSSFLQRAYDQVFHDVCLQNLDVIFAIDRAGIVGEDGETHHGVYDISYLSHLPNITCLAPCDYNELEMMLNYAVFNHNGPISIRYPRGKGERKLIDAPLDIELGKGEIVREGTDITIVAIGNMVETALQVEELLRNKNISVEVINARFIKPIDEELIIKSAKKTGKVVTIEDNVVIGGFGSIILEVLNRNNLCIKFRAFGFPDEPIQHGKKADLFKKYKLDAHSIAIELI